MTPLSDEDLALLRQVRSLAPAPEVTARLRSRLVSQLGAGATGGVAAPVAGKLTAGAAKTLVLSTVGVVLVGSLIGLGLFGLRSPRTLNAAPPRSASSVTALSVPTLAKVPTTHDVESLPLAAPETTKPDLTLTEPSRSAKATATPPDANTLDEELRLLGSAQRAMQSGDWSTASEALETHAKRFPKGALATERQGLRLVVLCRSGRQNAAQTEAKRFLAAQPGSTLSARIRSACEL